MDDPVNDIEGVVRQLMQTGPSVQKHTIETYFTSNASFTHPFCRTGTFNNSRLAILAIYRWAKILSPHIELTVHSVAFDQRNLVLYATIFQDFRIWFVPFYRAPVTLTTVLHLQHDTAAHKYYIRSQEDLYQTDQFVRFVVPYLGTLLVGLWQLVATAFCVLGAFLGAPVSWWGEEKTGSARKSRESNATWSNATWGDAIEGDATGGDAIEGDAIEGDATGGDATGGDAIEGDAIEGDAIEGDATGGDATESDAIESNATWGDAIEGDATEGDATEGDSTMGLMEQEFGRGEFVSRPVVQQR